MKSYNVFNQIIIGTISVLLICISCIHLSCNNDATEPFVKSKYHVPVQTGDGWETANAASVGINETILARLLDNLDQTSDHRIHSILIVKDGKLVFEVYFPGDKFNLAQPTGETGFDMYDTHNLCSVTKSFTSALTGIAINRRYIQSVEQKVFDFFPEYANLLTAAPEKNDLTLAHLLTMTSGIDWDDESTPYTDPENDLNRLFNSHDPIKFILAKDLVIKPGTVYDYDNCNTNLLGEIVGRVADQRLDEFSDDYLFSKLGITDFEWQMLPNNVVFCSGDLRLRPRDMAKFGYLFLNGGMWNGERIISQEWVDLSTQKHIDPNEFTTEFTWADGYGYQWWIWEDVYGVDYPAYFAAGWGGQYIIISPEMNTIVVSTAGNYYTHTEVPIEEILVDYVIPAISH
jgi:CubicO group peptidase (beta-lactamase class C family)